MEEKRFVTKDNTKIFYWHNVVNNGPTLIFIHGAGSNHTVYKPFLTVFKDHNFVALDLANHGKSGYRDVSKITMEALADDIWQLCQLEKLKHVIPIGNCLGASVAMEFYKQHRWNCKKLVLLTLFSKRYVRFSGIYDSLASVLYFVAAPFSGKRTLKFQDYHKYEKRPVWYYPYLDFRGTPVTTCLKLAKELFRYELFVFHLKVPTLLVCADGDWSTRSDLIKSDVKGNQKINVVGIDSNHVPLTRVAEDVIRTVRGFLSKKSK
jgi:pimeloyl-ACP methyl ester carboxylesterase